MADPRGLSLTLLEHVLYKNQNLDDAFDAFMQNNTMERRDRAFVRMLTTTTIRRLGQIDALLSKALEKPLPMKGRSANTILRLGVAQLMFMDVPDHAAVSTSVDLARATGNNFYVPLINGVLRTISRTGNHWLKKQDAAQLNTPDWLYTAWEKAYGTDMAHAIATANLNEPTFDVTVKNNPTEWAQNLGGILMETGSVRLPSLHGTRELPGFEAGAWWVQDAAASIPVQVLNPQPNERVADFCAAPGSKTAQIANTGATVDAIDISKNRTARVEENLKRLHLTANIIIKDATKMDGTAIYDKILIDAPCSATGTIRRHPDLFLHRTPDDIRKLNDVQIRLLKAAHRLLKPNGSVVYCTCSLQREEGEDIIAAVADLFDRAPIDIYPNHRTQLGDIRTFPTDGMDGFFIAHLRRK